MSYLFRYGRESYYSCKMSHAAELESCNSEHAKRVLLAEIKGSFNFLTRTHNWYLFSIAIMYMIYLKTVIIIKVIIKHQKKSYTIQELF